VVKEENTNATGAYLGGCGLGGSLKETSLAAGFQASLRNLGTTPSLSAEYFLPATSTAKLKKNFKDQWPFNTPSQGF